MPKNTFFHKTLVKNVVFGTFIWVEKKKFTIHNFKVKILKKKVIKYKEKMLKNC